MKYSYIRFIEYVYGAGHIISVSLVQSSCNILNHYLPILFPIFSLIFLFSCYTAWHIVSMLQVNLYSAAGLAANYNLVKGVENNH